MENEAYKKYLESLSSKRSFEREEIERIIKAVYPDGEIMTPDEALGAISKAEKQLSGDKYPLDEIDVIEHTELVLEGTVESRDLAQMEIRYRNTFGIGAKGDNTNDMDYRLSLVSMFFANEKR